MANNVINAVFSSSTITYTKPAYQYDYGMILRFSGIELPQAYEVHFSNTEFCGESISQIGDESGVTIPDEMFLSGAPIYAWTFLHAGEDDGETVYKTVISINKRAQPSDIEPTPVQQDVITQAIAALNTAVEQTAADVVASGESAQAAADSAEAAGQAKDDAVEAKDKAVEAKNAAETAQGKAEDAQRAAEQAAGSVLGLTADASVDSNVGTPSVDVVVTEESGHKKMTFTFRNLKGVQGDQGIGIASVVLNADYTLTITLTNGTSYTTTSIRGEVGATPNLTIGTISTLPEGSQATATITGTSENPVLNLGIPVGNTGATGNGIVSIAKTGTVGLVDTYTITYTDGTTSTFEVTNGADGEVSEEELTEKLADKADIITASASGEIVTIEDGANNLPIKSMTINLEPVQSGSGDPSPDNVRPISGWTGVEVYQSNINFLPLQEFRDAITGSVSASITVTDDYITLPNGANDVKSTASQRVQLFRGKFVDGMRYRILLRISSKRAPLWTVLYKDGTSTALNSGTVSESDGKYYVSYNTTAGKNVNYIRMNRDQGGSITYYMDTVAILPYGTTLAESKPHEGATTPVDWSESAGTVYGGYVDPIKGKLYAYPYYESYNGETLTGHWISDRDVYAEGTTPSIGAQVLNDGGTPTEYDLEETAQIRTLLGTNNFWSNANGSLDLEYRCDTKLYIQQLTKPTEDDMVANANIASGRFFMIGNRLFLSSVAIEQGGVIIPGTNCTEIGLADALNSLNS